MDESKDEEISVIYKIFKEIYLKAPPILKDLSQDSVDIDYKEYMDEPIDFKTIKKKLQDEKYSSMTDVVKDIRLVFLNCYKFYGSKSDHTLRSIKLEELLEHKISDLDEKFKSMADIQLTLNLLNLEINPSFKFRYPKNCYDSVLLRCVAHCRNERLKEYHKILSATLTTDVDNANTLEELTSWENETYFNDHYQFISSMWELPEIGNFMAILFKELDLDIINQGEIERMFLMPKESTTMSKIMTILLKPIKKTKFDGQLMSYNVWSGKLSKKISDWYKVYHTKKQNKVRVMNALGIHPDFWVVFGNKNPLVDSDYCELSYFMKVWLVKGLCDHVISKFKTINDVISNCNERQNTIWKNDMETEEYFYFSSMPDLRVYYYNIPYDEPGLEFLESQNTDIEIGEQSPLPISSISSYFHETSRLKPNEKHFKLIADSVQGLRSFVEQLDTEDSSVPENLIIALENLIIKFEPQEYNLIVSNNNSKIKLFKDWKSYPERLKKEEDLLHLKEKELKSKSNVLGDEIIMEKRKRKAIVKPDFDIDIQFESDDNLFESDVGSITDFTDSDDEWGAMNQSKNKVKPPAHATSKLAELENRLRDENKMPKHHCTNISNIFDMKTNSLGIDKLNENEVGMAMKGFEENQKEKEVTCKNITNTSINGFCEELVCSIQMEDIKQIDVSSDEEVEFIDIEKEECKKSLTVPCKKQKFVDKNDKCTNEQPEIKKIKNDVLNNVDIVVLDDDKLDSSVSIISNDSVKGIKESNDEVISIEDDDQIVISDDDDDIQLISFISKPQVPPIKMSKPYTLNNNFKNSFNSISENKQLATTNYSKRQVPSTSIPKLSPNISIMPANVHVPRGIEVTMVKRPQNTITSHFNVSKRSSIIGSNSNGTKKPSIVDVQCKVISKPNSSGEVKFYINLPNGNLHPVSDELMNQYLKEHNYRLPDYWLVPLPVDVAKQYGFN